MLFFYGINTNALNLINVTGIAPHIPLPAGERGRVRGSFVAIGVWDLFEFWNLGFGISASAIRLFLA